MYTNKFILTKYMSGGYNFRGSDILPLAQNCVFDSINILCRHPINPIS